MTKAIVIDGKRLAKDITDRLKASIAALGNSRPPGLATILVGHDTASTIYVANKRKKAEEVGIKSFHYQMRETCTESELHTLVKDLNADINVDAILIQLPLPKTINENHIIEAIDPKKDVDGFHPFNLGQLLRGDPKVVACTPLGIMHLIDAVNFDIAGKNAVVIGRSTIVGKPVAQLLLQRDATVTICHSKTKDLSAITKNADLIVAAVGKPKMLNKSHIKPGAFLVDVGINRDENSRLCGDVDFADVIDVASYITPVPGGVGPLTIAMLLKNTFSNFMRAHR